MARIERSRICPRLQSTHKLSTLYGGLHAERHWHLLEMMAMSSSGCLLMQLPIRPITETMLQKI